MKTCLKSLFLLMIIGLFAATSWAAEVVSLAGTGTETDPFTISTIAELEFVRDQVNNGTTYAGQVVTLDADLTLTDTWTPIGTGTRSSKTYSGNAFKGIFDGGDHTISGLKITSTTSADAALGFFGVVDGGTVKNLKLDNVDINVATSDLLGGAIGLMVNNATAENITVSGAIVGYDGVGGIVGRQIISGTISKCTNNASVTSAYGGIGGIVGKCYYEDGSATSVFATISECVNNGVITAPKYVGGIVGLARANVTKCVNNGAIVGGTQTGGVIGQLIAAGAVSENENKATISGTNHLGGIIGDYTQSNAYTYNNVTIEKNINYGELTATEQCAAIMGCNNIDGFTAMTATGNASYYYVDGLELFGNPEDMVIDDTNTFLEPIVAYIGTTGYTTLADALTAANAMTGDVTVEILGAVEFVDGMELNGQYTSITFTGTKDASITINQTAGGDYLTAHGKTVAFNGLTLAKANPAWSNNAGHMGNYFSVQGGTVAYTDCVFSNGACTSGGTATYTNCTFQNASEYGLWVYDDAIVTVTGGTIDSAKGIKVYSEDETSVTSALTVQNATFTANVTKKPAVAIGYAESITLIGNTYNNTTGVLELDSGTDADCEGITFVAKDAEGNDISSTVNAVDRSNSNAACGVLVDGKIYTTVAEAAAVATAGSTVTLLHNSTETVELPVGVTLNKNSYTAAGITVAQPVASITVADTTTTYTSLQTALDAAQDGQTVVLLADVDEDVLFVQETDVDVIIDGNGKTLTGTLAIHGGKAYDATNPVKETLLVKNLIFQSEPYNATTKLPNALIYTRDRSDANAYAYSHNVTIEGCTFKGVDANTRNAVAAIRHKDGGDWNWTIKNCTANDNLLHSLLQVNNIGGDKGLIVEGCNVQTKNGMNINYTPAIKVTGSTIAVDGYVLRAGVKNSDAVADTFTFTNNKLSSTATSGDDAIITLRGTGAVKATINMEGNVATTGNVHIYGTTADTTINADANYWGEGKTAPDVNGNAEVEIESYYADAALTQLVLANPPVAQIGDVTYDTLQAALDAIGEGDVVIELLADATLDYGAREAYGLATTTSVTINGNGHTLTLNQTNSDWSSVGLANTGAKLVLNGMTIEKTGHGDTSGAWNKHAIIFSCNVEMSNVIVNNSVAVQGGATLTNVTINEANGYYGLWINGNGQSVTINGGAINATNGGRGIKIADQYIDNPASVTLNVTGMTFNTAKKAAVLVTSTAGANITVSNVDITNVVADSTNFAWVDADRATNYGNVTVTGATKAQEDVTTFGAAIMDGDTVKAYYATFADALTAAVAGDTIELLAEVESTDVILIDKNLTINGNNHSITSSATRVIRVTTANTEVTLNKVNVVSRTVMEYPNDIRGISIDNVNGVKLTLNDCSVDFTDATACDWAYAINQSGENSSGNTITINGGTYEGANVINIWGTEHTVAIDGATLTSLYAANDLYYGVCVKVNPGMAATVTVKNTTFNGTHAVAAEVANGTITQTTCTDNTKHYALKVGNVYCYTLEEAINAATDGATITLIDSVDLTETVTVPAVANITLDLNGKTISMADASSAAMCAIKNNGTLTITDGSETKSGKITFSTTTPSTNASYASNTISNHGTITIGTGTIENTTVGGACYALDNYAGSTATINGGKLSAKKTTVRIFNWTNGDAAKATLNINGGEIYSADGYGVNINAGNSPAIALNITGGTITTDNTVYNLGVYIVNKGSAENLTVNVSGGTIEGVFGLNGVTCTTMKEDAVAITGGTFGGVVCYDTPANGFISGGTFADDVTDYCADGFVCTANDDGTYGVIEHVLAGEGTEANPYVISTVADIVLFRDSVNAGETKYNAAGVYVALAADIDLAGIDWSVNIGDAADTSFDGIFDGNGKTICNLKSVESAKDPWGYICTGLFGCIANDAQIKNLTLENVDITAEYVGNNVAALVGFAYKCKGAIDNVTVKNVKINAANATGVGAIVGYDYYSPALTVKECVVDGTSITAKSYVGGIIGYASNKIQLKDNTVKNLTITGTGSVGGVAGIMLAGASAAGNTIEKVSLSATGELWANSIGLVAGTMTNGAVTVSNTIATDCTVTDIVGGILVEKPIDPIAKIAAQQGDTYYTSFDAAVKGATDGDEVALLVRPGVGDTTVKAGKQLVGAAAYDVANLLGGAFVKSGNALVYSYELGISAITYVPGAEKPVLVTVTLDDALPNARALKGRYLVVVQTIDQDDGTTIEKAISDTSLETLTFDDNGEVKVYVDLPESKNGVRFNIRITDEVPTTSVL